MAALSNPKSMYVSTFPAFISFAPAQVVQLATAWRLFDPDLVSSKILLTEADASGNCRV